MTNERKKHDMYECPYTVKKPKKKKKMYVRRKKIDICLFPRGGIHVGKYFNNNNNNAVIVRIRRVII